MTAVARHRQAPISFRSNRAADLLAQLTRGGRSQAQVIEDALEAEALRQKPHLTREELRAEIDAAIALARGYKGPSYAEIKAGMFDENGLPR